MKISLPSKDLHTSLYIGGLALLLCCMPLSRYFMSISQFILAGNWLLIGNLKERLSRLRRRPLVWIFVSVVMIYVLGLVNTANMPAALVKVRNVLPLLLLPVILGTEEPLNRKTLYHLLILYILAVATAALICLVVYRIHPHEADRDFRKISLFMPHIRFALLIILAICIALYLQFFRPLKISPAWKVILPLIVLFLTGFLFVLRSFAGIILLIVSLSLFFSAWSRRLPSIGLRRTVRFVIALFYLVAFLFVVYTDFRNFHPRNLSPVSPRETTANGNPYENDMADKTLENGYYVNRYVCDRELEKAWNANSSIPFSGMDAKGQLVRYTLRRYMTSLGLRKDSAGFSRLTPTDIRAVEKGMANYRFREKPGLSQRLYETLWEIHMWQNTGYVRNHSFGQRIAYLQAAGNIIRKHPLTGVGTGDVYDGMLNTVHQENIEVESRWKGEPHNQYAFFMMAFGIPAFLWILFAWIYPVWRNRTYLSLLFLLFALINGLSMFVLDTLESYNNMVYFAFFYALFVFGMPGNPFSEREDVHPINS